jgi:C-terminal processing protease CtpA/Prc
VVNDGPAEHITGNAGESEVLMRTFARGFAQASLILFVAVLLCCTTLASPPGPQSPSSAVTVQQNAAEQYYHKVWELIRDNLLYRDRLVNWGNWEHKFDGTLNNQADAERAVRQMLQSLNDPYTFFKDASATKAQQKRDDSTGVVTWKVLPNNIGYVKITTFSSKSTGTELKAALTALNGVDGYIIDLRGNLGGYVDQALSVFSLLVDTGSFTTLKGVYLGKSFDEEYSMTASEVWDKENGRLTKSPRIGPNLTGNKPMAVLVNANSASASEMLTGALRDHARADIVGVKTYGKGIAQRTWTLDGGTSVQITFAEYFLPKGDNIHGKGITPAHEVKASMVIGDDQLDEAVRLVTARVVK